MKSKRLHNLLGSATDWRTLMTLGVIVCVVITFSRYCDIFHVGALQAYILFPLSFFVLSQLLYQQEVWRHKDMWLAAAVFLWTVVSMLLNRDVMGTPLLSGDYQHLCVSLFLCYPLAGALDPERRKKTFRLLAAVNVIGVSLLCYFALYCVIFNITPEVPFACEHPLVMLKDRLHLFANPNGVGAYCQAAALLCIYLLLSAQSIWKRVLEIVGLVGILCVLSLTDSRTAILCFAVGVGMLVYLIVTSGPRPNKKCTLQQLIAIVCAAVAIAICVIGIKYTNLGINAFRKTVQANVVTQDASIAAPVPTPNTTVKRLSVRSKAATPNTAPQVPVSTPTAAPKNEKPLQGRSLTHKLSTLNNRTLIWQAIGQALSQHSDVLLYGTSSYADTETFEKDFPVINGKRSNDFHSSLLSLLVCYGIPGLVVWLAFLAAIFVCGARVFFASPERVGLPTRFLMCLLVTGFLAGTVECLLFTNALPQANHTWLLLAGGLAVTTEREMRLREKQTAL